MDATAALHTDVEYIANPSFSFPAQPDPVQVSIPPRGPRRAASLNLDPTTPQRISSLERRSASTLPTFSFNAADTSGRADSPGGPSDQPEAIYTTNTRSGGHRRGTSEYIGGKRGANAELISTSPSKEGHAFPTQDFATAAATGSPMKKRGHAHRRSSAVSSKEVSIFRRSNGVDSSPETDPTPEGSPSRQAPPPAPPAFPVVGRRVGFSSTLEFIPRPLSTISSEAESIISTTGRQSPSGSVSSPRLSLVFNPLARRKSRSTRSSLSEVEFASRPKSMPRDVDRKEDGPHSDPYVSHPSQTTQTADNSGSRGSISWSPGPHHNVNRRSSEPTLSLMAMPKPRRSSVSLREPLSSEQLARPTPAFVKRKSSASRVKAWATSVIHRKDRKTAKEPMSIDIRGRTEDAVPAAHNGTPISEAELEEMFSRDPFSNADDDHGQAASVGARMDMETLRNFAPTFADSDDSIIDLDAAMSSTQNPSRDGRSPSLGSRRQMHSSRMNRDFVSPTAIYHRRAESAPALTPFDFPKSTSPVHSPMADVFEEEEEEDDATTSGQGTPNVRAIPDFKFPQGPLQHDEANESGLGISRDAAVEPRTPTAMSSSSEEPAIACSPTEMHERVVRKELPPTRESNIQPSGPTLAPRASSVSLMAPNTAMSTPDVNRWRGSLEIPRIGTSASSMADTRTLSSLTSDKMETRPSVDDVPSLTSSRSTMLSSLHPPRREVFERPSSVRSTPIVDEAPEHRRRKRTSIQGLAKLMSGPFGESKSKLSMVHGNASSPDLIMGKQGYPKRENRLSKLMFWRRQGSRTQDSMSG